MIETHRASNEIVEKEIPEHLKSLAEEKRAEMIEHISEGDETLCDKFLNEEPISDLDIAQALRRATTALRFTPVFVGSAYKNTGVQALLDGVCAYLPDPSEVNNQALDAALPPDAAPVPLVSAQEAPLVGLAFKLEEGRYGQLTYMRVYQGELRRGGLIYNARTGKKVKVPRLVRMHSDEMEVCQSLSRGLSDWEVSSSWMLYGDWLVTVLPTGRLGNLLSDRRITLIYRTSSRSAPARSVPCLVSSARLETPLPTAPHRTLW